MLKRALISCRIAPRAVSLGVATKYVGLVAGRRYCAPSLNSISQNLIPVINRLQEATSISGTDFTLNLPQLVVIGSQSSGKSSVLESLVGREFLPRGTGIVTRCPLILQLHKTEAKSLEYAEFSHLPHQKFTDFKKVSQEIINKTEQITGSNKGISTVPIVLKVFSPNVIPLTLVDTPGFTKIAVGDQPKNIQTLIEGLVHEYIANPNSIILAVHPANQDFSLSDGVSFARKADKSGNRTLGVLTKLDIIDKGVDPVKFFTSNEVPLKLGYYGVINRNQQDINNDKPVKAVREDEKAFFSNPVYAPVIEHCGIDKLAAKCNQMLTTHIRNVLPQLKNDVKQRLATAEQRLVVLGEPLKSGEAQRDKKWMMMQILNAFNIHYNNAIEGAKTDIQSKELMGGARIRYIFDDVFKKSLKDVKPTEGLSVHDFRTAIRNAAGPRPSLFVPDGAFESLAKKQIQLLQEPALQAAELVLMELERIVSRLDIPDLNRFPPLRDRVVEVCNNTLRDCMKPAVAMINNLIDCELAYINTNHPEFAGNMEGQLLRDGVGNTKGIADIPVEKPAAKSGGFFSSIFGGKSEPEIKPNNVHSFDKAIDAFARSGELTDRERMQINLLQKLLVSYVEISKRNIHDGVTKAIWHFLVSQSRDKLSKILISEIYHQGELKNLMVESDAIVEERKSLKVEIEMLRKASEILNSTTPSFL